jgi:hypothetical protein
MKKKIAIIVLVVVSLAFSGCANTKVIDGVEYDTYGLLNKDEKKNEKIQYELVWGNIVWGAILFSSVVAPVYFYGFSMCEPVGKKGEVVGQVSR